MTTTAPAELRRLLAGPDMVRAPGVYDGLGAHLARRAGFSAVYLTGAGVAVSGYGVPDIGLVTATEMVERLMTVVAAAELPVIADADTGFGTPLHVIRAVRAYEQAGAAAIQLEDQSFPKKCGHLSDKELIDTDEFVLKLHAAIDARRDGIVVIARTDARAPLGIDEAIARGKRYAAEGADMVFVEAPESLEEIERIATEIDAPLLFNVVPSGRSPQVDDAVLEKLGFRLAIYPAALLEPVTNAMVTALSGMTGRGAARVAGPADIFRQVGLDDWSDAGNRYRAGSVAHRRG